MQNLTIFLLPTERVAFYNMTGGLPLGEGKIYPPLAGSPMDKLLKRPTREPWPPARLRPGGDSAPE
ncbi:MAG: hypothetical protein ACQEQO_07710, partial [Thermodesulfobacteriota bacterium]